jgi:hypothetical protein
MSINLFLVIAVTATIALAHSMKFKYGIFE